MNNIALQLPMPFWVFPQGDEKGDREEKDENGNRGDKGRDQKKGQGRGRIPTTKTKGTYKKPWIP